MAIPAPELRVISSWISREQTDDKSVKVWEISTPLNKNLTWAIMMSYLFSSINSKSDIEKTLRQFKGCLQDGREQIENGNLVMKSFTLEALKKRVFKFNPFKNRYAFYNDNLLQYIHQIFEEKLDCYVQRGNKETSYEEQQLRAASVCLKCFIIVYETNSEGETKLHCPKFSKRKYSKKLILFKNLDRQVKLCFPVYSFGMSLNYALPLRKNAFVSTASVAKFPNYTINRFKNIISVNNDFLICALKSSCEDIIHYLYGVPYISKRLSEGGINIDPRVTDSHGLSAFYYCMCIDDPSLMRLLYNYASNNFFMSESNTRNPNKGILDALKEIGLILRNDYSKSYPFLSTHVRRVTVVKICRQFIRFNAYQCDILQEIISIREKNLAKIAQQQEIMISILDNYIKYFHFESTLPADTFDSYVLFSEYYSILDQFTCFLFFDTFVSLVPMANDTNVHIYTNAIKSLFLYILANKQFPQKQESLHEPCLLEELSDKPYSKLRFIPFLYRNDFQKHAVTLSKELKTSIEQQHIPSSGTIYVIRESICGLPEIENEILARKIRNYLAITENITTQNHTLENIFTFERILQVIGDLICNDDVNECVVKFLLCSCLPEGLEKKLCRLRNHCLSKYRQNSIQGRLTLESNENVSKNIQSEITRLFYILNPTLTSNFLRIEEFMTKRGIQESKDRFPDIFDHIHRKHEQILNRKKLALEQSKNDYGIVAKNLFYYIDKSLDETDPDNVKKMKGKLRALTFLTNYISVLLHDEIHLKALTECCEKLELLSNIDSKELPQEVKENIMATVRRIKLIYNNIFGNVDKLSGNEALAFPRIIYFIKVKNVITNMVFNNAYILSCTGGPMSLEELEEKMLNATSGVFKFDESHVKELINTSENVIRKVCYILPTLKEDDILNLSQSLKSIIEKVYQTKRTESESDLQFVQLNDMYTDIKDYDIFSPDEKQTLEKKVLQYLDISNEKKKMVIKLMKENNIVAVEKINFKTIVMPENLRKSITKNIKESNTKDALKNFSSLPDEFIELKPDENVTTRLMSLFIKEKYRNMFLRISIKSQLRKKIYRIMNQKLYFLINRIEEMKKILINGDEMVKALWLFRKKTAVKQYIKHLMCHRYMQERKIRAALEMLFFDCLSVLQNQELKTLWEKTSKLFTGIDLRDLLSHGSPVIEVVSGFLDPEDVPLEFIDKILSLIDDKIIICSLLELWIKVKCCKVKDLEDVLSIQSDDDYTALRKQIKRCPRWRNYFKLLPLEI